MNNINNQKGIAHLLVVLVILVLVALGVFAYLKSTEGMGESRIGITPFEQVQYSDEELFAPLPDSDGGEPLITDSEVEELDSLIKSFETDVLDESFDELENLEDI